jgi:hypothetical protein
MKLRSTNSVFSLVTFNRYSCARPPPLYGPGPLPSCLEPAVRVRARQVEPVDRISKIVVWVEQLEGAEVLGMCGEALLRSSDYTVDDEKSLSRPEDCG